MSLILEALKKSERQRQVGTAPTLATPTMTRRPRRSILPWLIGAMVVAAGVGAWLSRDQSDVNSSRDLAKSTDAPAAPTATAAAVNEAKPAAPMTTLPPPPPIAAVTPTTTPIAAPIVNGETTVAETAAAMAAAAPRQRSASAAAAATAPPAAEPAPAPVPRTSPTPTGPMPTAAATPAADRAAAGPGVATPAATSTPGPTAGLPLLWELPYEKRKDMPKLGMSLQVYSADPANRFAIVNDERRKEGDTISDGLVLREITPDGLIIEFQGERFLYPRGGR